MEDGGSGHSRSNTMTNFDDRFGRSGGQLFKPDPSKTFKDPGTLAFNSGTGGKLEGSGQRAPVIDSIYEHLNIPVKVTAGSTGFTMSRGRNMGGAVWSNDFGSPPTVKGTRFAQAYWYNTTANFLYWASYEVTGDTISAIQKVNVVDGTWTELMAFDTILAHNANGFGQVIYPVTPATPDTSDWVVIYPEQNTPYTMRVAVYNSAGVQQSDAAFRVDIGGGEEDEVNFQGGYITASNDLIMSPIYGIAAPSNILSGYMSFSLIRGASRIQIVLPLDGIAPLPESDINLTTTGIAPFFNVMLTAWGDSVIALVDNETTGSAGLLAHFGTRIWDRGSFDTELHRLADIYSAAPAEAYF